MNEREPDIGKLTALLDNELAEPERSSLLHRLEQDAALAAEHDRLVSARKGLDAAFGALLDAAPLERLRSALPPAPAARPRRSFWFSPRGLAAGFVAGALLGAALATAVALREPEPEDDWTSAVLNYMQLYSADTFAPLHPGPKESAQALAALGAKLGIALTPEAVALPDLTFRAALSLVYDEAPLGEVVLTDSTGAPNLFCILAEPTNDEALRVTTRAGYVTATWAKRGKRFLVVGKAGAPAAQWAQTLIERL